MPSGGLIAWFFFFGRSGFLFNQRVGEATSTEKSIAVLPFESLSDNKERQLISLMGFRMRSSIIWPRLLNSRSLAALR